jgi:hypothetical protein
MLFSDALQAFARTERPELVLTHYVDDFLGIAATRDMAQATQDTITALADKLGLPMAPTKHKGPDTIMDYLGILIDCDSQTLRLPPGKQREILELIETALAATWLLKATLEKLVGKLNFACKAVPSGRPLMQSLFIALQQSRAARKLRLRPVAHSDLESWHFMLRQWSGVARLMPTRPIEASAIGWATDASGSIGYGAIMGGQWMANRWSQEQAKHSITYKELYAVVVSAHTWDENLAGRHVILECDNEAVVRCINKMGAKDKDVRLLLRELLLILARIGAKISARHVAGKLNVLPDLLSRGKIGAFEKKWRNGRCNASVQTQPKIPATWENGQPSSYKFSGALQH